MASTPEFHTIDIEAEDDKTNAFTTNGTRANNTFASTPPKPSAQSCDRMTLMGSNTENDPLRLSSPFRPLSTSHRFLSPETNSTSFSHCPTLVSSVFPNELPNHPAPRPSLINRVFNLSPPSTRSAHSDKHGPNTFRTPDIEMGVQDNLTRVLQRDDRLQKTKFALLITGGTVLCLMMGMLVYLVVRYAVDEDRH
jgi:hypothetical protein